MLGYVWPHHRLRRAVPCSKRTNSHRPHSAKFFTISDLIILRSKKNPDVKVGHEKFRAVKVKQEKT